MKKKTTIIIGIIALIGAGYFAYTKIFASKKTQINYQTSTAEKGILINSISASGTITSGNVTYITTGASGTVKKVYVKNGDTVKKDQKLAELTLDDIGSETQTTAWANYQNAVENQKTAEANRLSADIQMWKDRQTVLDATEEYNNMYAGGWNPKTKAEYTYNEKAIVEKTLELAKKTFTADELIYNNSAVDITLAKSKVQAAWRNYQKVSGVIYAPASGVVNNLILAEGVVISDSSNSSITVSTGTDSSSDSISVSSQKIGAIKNPQGKYQATLSLTEVDVTKIQSGQKVTLTMDAFPDITLTGSILAVNTSGSVNSNVTSYTATVLLDETTLDIYTNMAVSATIITSTKSDVILIPSTAVKTFNGQSTIQIMKDNQPTTITVEIGDSNDTQIEIISGINEGDVVITSSINTSGSKTTNTKSSSSSGSSLFGGNNMGGMGGMGAPLRN